MRLLMRGYGSMINRLKKMDVEWMDVIKGGKLEITIRQHSKSVMYGHE